LLSIRTPQLKLAVVVGGGNFFRGRNKVIVARQTIDYAGMLGTIINGIILKDLLGEKGVHLSSLAIQNLVDGYQIDKAEYYLKQNKILILSGGTGHPFFSTDTAMALRALELNADLILKGTNVDGIYSEDPKEKSHVQFLQRISYEEALSKHLKILDEEAFVLLKDKKIPLIVFNIFKRGNLKKVLAGKKIGSVVC
jgi:uridylate kinase